MKIAFTTLGCKLNYAETSTYERGFVAAGWEVVPWSSEADVYLVNTCAVTETAEKKSRNYIRRAHAVTPLTAIQNRYSMMARWHECLFPVLEELGIGFMAFSPLANGLLSEQYPAGCIFDKATDYRAGMPQFREESFEANQALFALVDSLADRHKATPAQISLAWMLCKKPWIVPIPGTRKFFRLKENIGAADIDISLQEIAAIDKALDSIPISEVYGGTQVIKQ